MAALSADQLALVTKITDVLVAVLQRLRDIQQGETICPDCIGDLQDLLTTVTAEE